MSTKEEQLAVIATICESIPSERLNDDIAFGVSYAIGYLGGLDDGFDDGITEGIKAVANGEYR